MIHKFNLEGLDGPMEFYAAGQSDKYGQVYTEREGSTSWTDPDNEPVALFRAQDKFAVELLVQYKQRCKSSGCHPDHIASIDRQIARFALYREQHPDKVRLPGPEYHPQ